jgi:Tol biopolymer transport system component
MLLSLLMGWAVPSGHVQAEEDTSINQKGEDRQAKVKMSRGRPITGKADFIVPRWSPDGRFILLTKGKYSGLYLLSLEDRSLRTLNDSSGVGFAAKWSQDGRAIAFTEDDQLKIIDQDGRPMATEHTPPAEEPSVVFAQDDTIYFRDNQTGQRRKVSDGEDRFFLPQLSPDRKKVVYIGLSTGIHIQDLESGSTMSIGLGIEVAWAPDSKGIIFTYIQDDGHKIVTCDLFYADAGTGALTNLTHTSDRHESYAAISPKGTNVAYTVDGQVFFSELSYEIP